MSANGKLVLITAVLFLFTVFSPMAFHGHGGDASAWTDGNRDSPVMPNYGIQDMIADKSFKLLENRSLEKAEFIRFWFDQAGANGDPDSYDADHVYPLPDDNFLAWTDDGPEGVTVDYFINNPEPGQDPQTDAVQYAQMLANRTVENLTKWMLGGKGTEEKSDIQFMHAAAYNAGKLSKYIGDMSQYGHTDYTKWDQLSVVPTYHPSEIDYPYREYYEARVWSDTSMETLYNEFWDNRTFNVPTGYSVDSVHTYTSDMAKWVNSRGQPPVQILDYDGISVTVGHNYRSMLMDFMYCWEQDISYNGVRGFNASLWELTLENLVAAAENLSAIYESIYDRSWSEFMALSPELNLVNWSVTPDPTISGDEVVVNATIRNDGQTIAENFKIELFSQGISGWRGLTLAPGEEKNISFLPFPVIDHAEYFRITIDYEEKIAESDETNNLFEGMVTPIPEVHSSTFTTASPFPSIRRDTEKVVQLKITNTGNRMDTFAIEASTDTTGIEIYSIGEDTIVPKFSSRIVEVIMTCAPDTSLTTATIELSAVGANSTATFDLTLQVLERSVNPTPVITGPSWGRIGEDLTLSALASTDPDGDSLYFKWIIPLRSNSTLPEITVNYTKVGVFNIELRVYDGNVTSTLIWPLRIYPNVPDNVSAYVSEKGVSGLTVTWNRWMAGGLVAVWLEATADPDQGEKSERGPYISRIEPGNTSGRVGKFLPGTEIELKVTIEAERFGNITTDIITTSTQTIAAYEDMLNLNIEDSFLYLKYKPWVDPEGVREPEIVVERIFGGEFIPVETIREDIQKTRVQDTFRYPLGSNSGIFRASLVYYWINETISPFSFYHETVRENMVPVLNMSGTDLEFRLNINGTCRVWFVLGVEDPEDTMKVNVWWGDDESEDLTFYVGEDGKFFQSLFHNYSEIDQYDLSIMVEDWNGAVSWYNKTIEILEYKETKAGEKEERSVWTLVGLIILGIFIVIALVVLGFIAYKVSKKDTEVEFKMKDFKSDIEKQKPGTGTDFDKRRTLQIPTESIMTRPKIEEEEETAPTLSGKITFDDEE